jgi:hypothetical protein
MARATVETADGAENKLQTLFKRAEAEGVQIDLDAFEDDKVYRCTLQLGPRRSFKRYRGMDPIQTQVDGVIKTVYGASVHEDAGPFSGRQMRGLAVLNNEWVTARKKGKFELEGSSERQTLVLNWRETKEQAEEWSAKGTGRVLGDVMNRLADILERVTAKK